MVPLEAQSKALIWAGKGHDKRALAHGSTLLDDLWIVHVDSASSPSSPSSTTTTSAASAELDLAAAAAAAAAVSWQQVPQSPSTAGSAPDGRWKSSGDRIGNFFFVFGGDDGGGFLNDLWVLPLDSGGFGNTTTATTALAAEEAGREQRRTASASVASEDSDRRILGVSCGGSSSSSSSGGGDGEVRMSSEPSSSRLLKTSVDHDGDDNDDDDNDDDGKDDEKNDYGKASGGGGTRNTAVWSRPALSPWVELPHVRRGHTITAMPEMRALVLVGGRKKHEVCLHDAWILPLPPALDLFIGGAASVSSSSSGSTNPAADLLFDPALEAAWAATSWLAATPLPGSCRWGHSSVLVADPTTQEEMVAIFGGRLKNLDTGEFFYNSELWLFSATAAPAAPVASDDAAAAASSTTTTTTTTTTGRWTLAQTTEAVPPARDHHTSAPTSDGFGLFVFGGRTAESMDHAALNDLWRYSIATKSWKQLHPQGILPTVSNNHKPFFTFLSFYISHL